MVGEIYHQINCLARYLETQQSSPSPITTRYITPSANWKVWFLTGFATAVLSAVYISSSQLFNATVSVPRPTPQPVSVVVKNIFFFQQESFSLASYKYRN